MKAAQLKDSDDEEIDEKVDAKYTQDSNKIQSNQSKMNSVLEDQIGSSKRRNSKDTKSNSSSN